MTFIDSGILARLAMNPFSPNQLAPTAWWDVHLAGAAGQTITDQRGGTAATLGSTGGTDTNDPLWLVHSGTDYVLQPGTTYANRIETPDTATLRGLTGDLDLRADTAQTLWSGQAQPAVFIGKWAGGSQRCYFLRLNSDGKLELRWTADGNFPGIGIVSTVATGITNGARYQVRGTLTVNNGSAGNDVRFYTRDATLSLALTDNTSWTQLGTTVTTAGTTSVFPGTDPLWIGAYQDQPGHVAEAKIYRAIVMNGIGTTVLADFDASRFTTASASTYVDPVGTNAGTWTIVRDTAGRKSDLRKTYGALLHGVDDFFTVPAASIPSFGTATPGTVVVVGRMWPTPLSNGRWFDNRGSATETVAGVGIRQNGTADGLVGTIGDGTSSAVTAAVTYTAGQLVVASLVVDTTTIKLRVNGTESATVSRPAGSATGTTGIVGAATTAAASPAEFADRALLTMNRAATSSELWSLETYYGAGT